MKLLGPQQIQKYFGERLLFEGVSFDIFDNSKVGLIGANGTGKTTLLKLICGQIMPDEGSIYVAPEAMIGYMEQYMGFEPDCELYQETLKVFDYLEKMQQRLEQVNLELIENPGVPALIEEQAKLTQDLLEKGGLVYKTRTRAALLGMGFLESELSLKMRALSGGQRAKAQLAKLLLSDSNILLLDEPTNHLDIKSCQWLEDFLISYKGAYIVISHDRYFLDKVTDRTIELENNTINSYSGSYSEYMLYKTQKRLQEQKQYANAGKEIKRMELMIARLKRWNRQKSIKQAESKQKALDRLKAQTIKPAAESKTIKFNLDAKDVGGSDVLVLKNVSKAYDKPLFENVSLEVKRGERLAIIGPNGCGKTTLLEIIQGRLKPDSGEVKIGQGIKIAYFDQAHFDLCSDNSVLEEIWREQPDKTQTEIRNSLAAFLFRGDEVFKKISSLSGGERARVAILKLMLAEANLLILDEPTNHLDIHSREALENALEEFKGTIIAVSHDRFFINNIATKVCLLNGDGIVVNQGDYDDFVQSYEQKKQQPEKKTKNTDYFSKKERASEKRRLKGKLDRLENSIYSLESEISEMEEKLASKEIATDYKKAMELDEEIKAKKAELDVLLNEWEHLSITIEQ